MASSYEREVVHARQAWSCSEDRSTALRANIRTLEAQVRTLQTQHDRIEWQRQQISDMVTSAFGRIHALEARDRAHPDDLEDTDSTDALAKHRANRNSRNGDDSHDSGSGKRRQWFEKMESVFHISNCTVACQIKFYTCTLLGSALTWWNSHVKIVGHDSATECGNGYLRKGQKRSQKRTKPSTE
ncbi:hypothetical protein Tco_0681208 [Tanacetum coccineum]|uniref:Reverse transcriptase domain-containing protein n=1 Tax=Tanacetum coccineum TaxID=301880 RepID=A0ABQ4XN03_9ASTR